MVFRDFSSSGVETTGKKKRLKRCNLHCFLLVPKQNNAIYDVFSPSQPQNRAKTLVFTMFLQQPEKHM